MHKNFPPQGHKKGIIMALILHGGLAAEIRGSIAGATFSRNRAGAYVRNRTKPINPQTDRQIEIRQNLSYLQLYWHSNLSVALRSAWNATAQANPFKNRLGQSSAITGFNLFLRVNALRKLMALAIADNPPTPPLELDIQAFTISAITAPGLAITAVGPNFTADTIALVSYTGALSQARNFYKGPYVARSFIGPASPFPVVLDATIAVGDRYAYAWRAIDIVTNRVSPVMNSSVDCTA